MENSCSGLASWRLYIKGKVTDKEYLLKHSLSKSCSHHYKKDFQEITDQNQHTKIHS